MNRIAVFVAGACLAIGVTASHSDDATRLRYTPEESRSAPPGGQLGTAGVPGAATYAHRQPKASGPVHRDDQAAEKHRHQTPFPPR